MGLQCAAVVMPQILVHGNPALHTPSRQVTWSDPANARDIADLHRALADFQEAHGYGRAIAAPQIGVLKRIIAMNLGAGPLTLINPEIIWTSADTFDVWDDCMSVPDHVVRIRRHRSISVRYTDEFGRPRTWRNLPETMSELLQHEIDHLDGVVMVDRAVNADSVRPISQHAHLVGGTRPTHRFSFGAIAEASRIVDPVFRQTPQFVCDPLSDVLGCRLTLKVETVNPIRSFKGRGADYYLAKLGAQDGPLVCASAGNFGQALAYAARKHQRPLIVYASRNASPMKIERMIELGAEVRLHGEDFDAAKAEASRYSEEQDVTLVEDGREPEISEGAGSIGVELLECSELFEAVTVPLGNGALLTGVATWFKAASPPTEMVGVSSLGADAMEKSWRQGHVVEREKVDTIADGIAVRVPIPEAVADMDGIVDDVILVHDDHIVEAMRLLHRHAGLVVEPAGAAGLAGIVSHPERFRDLSVATVVAGGNLTPEDIRRYILD
ncbi:MAG TPA: pyridoxal-phosphate dependent enzyme [Acidimicrobiia bacterium]|nr:pyridoxal-phosphate dependent enzyme [Acidimicrobiia bacterium]